MTYNRLEDAMCSQSLWDQIAGCFLEQHFPGQPVSCLVQEVLPKHRKDIKPDAHLWGKIAILFHWLSIPFYFQFILIKMGLQLKLDNHLSHTAC